MRFIVRVSNFVVTLIVLLALTAVGQASAMNSLNAPIPPNIDVSQRAGNESEEASAVNPTNPNNIVIFTNIAEGANGMFLATSFDGGLTWNRRIVGEGNDVFGDTCCDPSLAFDEYGNLFVSYLYNTENTVPVLLSTDGGLHFELIAKIAKPVDSLVSPSGSERHGLFRYVDQETITAAEGEVWITFNAGGPMVAAGAHSPLDRVRAKLEETFGAFELTQTPNPQIAEAEADLVATLTQGIRDRCLVEIEYQKEGEQTWSKRVVEPYSLERELPNWRVHTWDRSRDAERSFRLDRMRSAQLTQESFVPRPAFEPRGFRDARSARILYLKGVAARWAAERGATLLKDGNALAEMPVGSAEWLIGEVLSQRGEAVLLEPDEMRKHVASRARELANELGVSRLRARA